MRKSTFIQLHLLTAYPPANLNRDDMGRPKTAIVGGVQRLRISSQSLKRAWRTSDVFAEKLQGLIGTRTKRVGQRVLEQLEKQDPKLANEVAVALAKQFGTLKTTGSGKDRREISETEQLVHLSPAEFEAITAVAEIAAEGGDFKAEAAKVLGRVAGAADIALFGRMLADHPEHNVEAAAQIGHAFSIHRALVEDDYFSAVDDLQGADSSGAGHIGVSEFGAGVFYQYVCVNRSELKRTLGDEGNAMRTLQALTEAVATVAPRGKIASYGSHARALYLLAERGTQTPRSLMSAFVKPVEAKDIVAAGIERLETLRDRMDSAYGPCADAQTVMNVPKGDGTLKRVLDFVGAAL